MKKHKKFPETYTFITPPQLLIAPLRRTPQHPQHLNTAPQQPSNLSPKLFKPFIIRPMIIQGNIARAIIKMYSRDNHVRDTRIIRQQGEQRMVCAVRVMESLVVDDQAGARGRRQ